MMLDQCPDFLVEVMPGCVRSKWSQQSMCAVNMDTAMPRTPVHQPYGSDKAFPEWGSERLQSLPLVQVQMLPVCANNAYHRFLPLDVYGLKTAPYRGSLPPCLLVCSYQPSCSSVKRKKTELLRGFGSGMWEPSLPTQFMCLSFLHSLIVPVRLIPGACWMWQECSWFLCFAVVVCFIFTCLERRILCVILASLKLTL